MMRKDRSPQIGSFFALSMSKGGSDFRLIPALVTRATVTLVRGLDMGVQGMGPLKSSSGMKVLTQALRPGGRNRNPSTIFLFSSIKASLCASQVYEGCSIIYLNLWRSKTLD